MKNRTWCRRWIFLVFLVGGVLPATKVVAETPAGAAESFLEGNRRYAENDFAAAVAAYEAVIHLGVTAPALEYNLANAYLKQGRHGLAILHYRRALELNPRFEDAQANLRYARASAQDIVAEESPDGSLLGWLGSFRLGPQIPAMWMLIVFTLFLGVAGMRLTRWRGRTWPGVAQGALGALILLLGAAMIFEWSELEGKPEGVVVVSEVDIRSGPAETYTVSFRLHEGTEVELIRKSSGWHEVKVSDRLQGWVPEDAVAEI